MKVPTSPLQPFRVVRDASPDGRAQELHPSRPRRDAPAGGLPPFAASPPPGADAPAAPTALEADRPGEDGEFVPPWRSLWLPDDLEDGIDFPPRHGDQGWDAFLPDDDELEPLPEPGDFWIENDHDAPVDAGQMPRRVA